MAKKSSIEKNARRRQTAERLKAKRDALRKILLDPEKSWEERDEARAKLMKLPRDANPNRYKNRCGITGRSRAYLRRFGISRIMFRELSLLGEIPGVRKASW